MYILDKVRDKLAKKIVAELLLSPEQRLTMFLYRSGRGDYYYTIAEMTGLGVATVCCIVSDVEKAIVVVLWESEVSTYMPKSETESYQKISDMEQMGGGGAFEGQSHILGGGQDIIFKKVLLFAHAVVTGLLSPHPGDSPPSQKGAIFLGILPTGDEYPRNIPPPPQRGAQEYGPPL